MEYGLRLHVRDASRLISRCGCKKAIIWRECSVHYSILMWREGKIRSAEVLGTNRGVKDTDLAIFGAGSEKRRVMGRSKRERYAYARESVKGMRKRWRCVEVFRRIRRRSTPPNGGVVVKASFRAMDLRREDRLRELVLPIFYFYFTSGSFTWTRERLRCIRWARQKRVR